MSSVTASSAAICLATTLPSVCRRDSSTSRRSAASIRVSPHCCRLSRVSQGTLRIMTARPGIDTPDARGRTGLDRAGRDLTGNPDVLVRDVELLAAAWHVLRRTTYDYRRADGGWSREQRETYDRGDGATVLLYDAERETVLLTRQFRYPVYVNGHPDGMFVETA